MVDAGDDSAAAPSAGQVLRIPLRRSVALVSADVIAVRPSRRQLLVPLAQLAIAAGSLGLIVLFLDRLPLLLLALLLAIAVLLGPVAMLSVVFSAIGSSFVAERTKGTARWQQGFLGLGIGTTDVAPFERIDHVRVQGDFDDELTFGDRPDLVQWDVQVVKDSGRVLDVGAVTEARAHAAIGLDRANRLATALGDLCGVEVQLGELPEDELEPEDAVAEAAPRSGRRLRRVQPAGDRTPPPTTHAGSAAAEPVDPVALISSVRTIAVAASSPDTTRPWHGIASYLIEAGFTVYLVNPLLDEALGRRTYDRVQDLPERVDLVDIFRRPDEVEPVVEDAIAAGAGAIWMQVGIEHPAAAARARAAGLPVVMDRCTMVEHRRALQRASMVSEDD